MPVENRFGLYDNMKLQRRELYLEWKGKEIFYGFCMKDYLTYCNEMSVWEPKVRFGSFPEP